MNIDNAEFTEHMAYIELLLKAAKRFHVERAFGINTPNLALFKGIFGTMTTNQKFIDKMTACQTCTYKKRKLTLTWEKGQSVIIRIPKHGDPTGVRWKTVQVIHTQVTYNFALTKRFPFVKRTVTEQIVNK